MDLPKQVPLPIFSGKKEDYDIWLPTFQAYCSVKNCQTSLNDSGNTHFMENLEVLFIISRRKENWAKGDVPKWISYAIPNYGISVRHMQIYDS